jgi:HSP20 family molecular chaperone IbpA
VNTALSNARFVCRQMLKPTDDITADFKDGVLTVKVPKVGPAPERSKQIKVGTT